MTTSGRVGSYQQRSLMARILLGLTGLVMTQYAADLFVLPASSGISSGRDYSRVRMYESVGFGKYSGQPWADVAETDPDYCSWVLGQAQKLDASPSVIEFATFIDENYPNIQAAAPQPSTSSDLDDNIVRMGKHKGKAYFDLIMEDPNYCEWVLSTIKDEQSNECMQHFAQWIDDNSDVLKDAKAMMPDTSLTVDFGKHRGQTYQWLLENEPNYCQWIMGMADPHPKAEPLIEWLRTQEIPETPVGGRGGGAHGTVNFGKHKGKSFEEVYEEDLQYCQWILDRFVSGEEMGGPMGTFADWLYKKAEADQEAEEGQES